MSKSSTRRKHPRISANALAQYMVSSDITRHRIIREAREPEEVRTTYYRDARNSVCAFLADPIRNPKHLATAEQNFKQRAGDPLLSCRQHEVAAQSVEVVHAIHGMRNELGKYQFIKAPWGKSFIMPMRGVDVSVRLDLLVHGVHRGIDQIGAAVLKMTKDDANSPLTLQRREDAGAYAAALVWLYVSQHLETDRTPSNKLCMSIDVRHGKAFVAPRRNSMRIRNLKAACQNIAALWDQV